KEFCNKYYLQTHKATKHGIPTMSGLSMVPTSMGVGSFGAFQSLPMTSSSIGDFQRSSLTAASNGADAQLRCPFCAQPHGNQLALQSHIMAFHNPLAPMGQANHPLHALYMSQMMAGMSNGASTANGHFGGGGGHLSSPLDFASNHAARWLNSSPQANEEGGGGLSAVSSSNGPSVLDRMQLMASGAAGLFSPSQLPPGFVPPSLSNLNQASTTPLSALAAALGQHTGVNVLHQGQITPQPSTSAGVLTQDRSPINK
uniref:Uncharacterized protein n=1 Tax=Plectus sambesii TaxID=2011161 RepID=A0A914UTW0_9BILA